MISKKIFVVSFCLVVLIIALGTYGYILYMEVSSLGSRLEDLQREINLLKYRIGFVNTSKTFNFFWGGSIAEKFNVTTFWMNITFQRTNETHLTITVKTNHLDFRHDYVGLAFDADDDGEIDGPGMKFYSTNESLSAYLGPYRDGQRFFEIIESALFYGLHTCTFDPQQGYTFVFPINLQKYKPINDLIHVEYIAENIWGTAVEFCFGMELIA